MDTIISYNRKIAVWKITVGLLILAFGLYNLFYTHFGVIPLLLGFMLLKTTGTEIDLASKTFRNTSSVLGVKIGSWKPLPEIEYVSVFATKESVTARALSAETTHIEDITVVNLFHDRNKKLTVYKTNGIHDAFDVAFHIADALLVDVLDATVKNDYRWVDKDAYRTSKKIVYVS